MSNTLTEKQFNEIYHSTTVMRTEKVMQLHRVSERTVNRVKEAVTWERWPYIVAKSQHGYRTPEYYAYLKRRKLPTKMPAKPVVIPRQPIGDTKLYRVPTKTTTVHKLTWWQRFLAWIRFRSS